MKSDEYLKHVQSVITEKLGKMLKTIDLGDPVLVPGARKSIYPFSIRSPRLRPSPHEPR